MFLAGLFSPYRTSYRWRLLLICAIRIAPHVTDLSLFRDVSRQILGTYLPLVSEIFPILTNRLTDSLLGEV